MAFLSSRAIHDSGVAAQEFRREQLDGLRSLLFLCVFSVHHFIAKLEFLSYALPVFFAMSGFLITRVLWQSRAETIGGKLKTFYVRRMIRIFPAYYFVLGCLLLFTDVQYPLAYVFYYLNLKIFALSLHPTPEFSALWADWDELATHNLHLWSLGVEEQFYILYPLLFFGLSRRVMGRVFVATIVVGVATRAWLMHAAPGSFYGFLLPSTVEYFAWGSLFAYLDLQRRLPSRRSSWWAIYAPMAAIAASVAIEYGFGLDGYYMMQTTHFTSIVAPLTGLLIWGLWTERPEHPLVRLLNLRPLVYLGTISYPMYLVHLSMWDVYRRFFAAIVTARVAEPAWQAAWFYAITLVLTIAAGSAIWHFVEVPAARLKRFFPLSTVTPQPVANGAAQTA